MHIYIVTREYMDAECEEHYAFERAYTLEADAIAFVNSESGTFEIEQEPLY